MSKRKGPKVQWVIICHPVEGPSFVTYNGRPCWNSHKAASAEAKRIVEASGGHYEVVKYTRA